MSKSGTNLYLEVLKNVSRAQNVWRLAQDIKQSVDNRIAYTFEIKRENSLFLSVSEWLLQHTSITIRQFEAIKKYESNTSELRLFVKPVHRQWITLEGERIFISFTERDPIKDNDLFSGKQQQESSLTLGSYTKKGSLAIQELLSKLASRNNEFRSMWIPSRYSGWEQSPADVVRGFENLVLSNSAETLIRNDLKLFSESEDQYNKFSLPYKRNYLFYGPPGTGKSSLAQAIAFTLDVDLYVLDISYMDKDAKLLETITEVPKGSVLLIEDIDAASVSLDREAKGNSNLSLSSILNILDGAISARGIITILTSNRPSSLDDALLRSGRMDVKIHLDYLDKTETEELLEKIIGRKVNLEVNQKICPADIMEIVKRNMFNHTRLIEEVKTYVKNPKPLDGIAEFEKI